MTRVYNTVTGCWLRPQNCVLRTLGAEGKSISENVDQKRKSRRAKNAKKCTLRRTAARALHSKLELKLALAGGGRHALSNRASFRGEKRWEGAQKRELEERVEVT